MISRRNIRVKVMQLLYMIEAADTSVTRQKPEVELKKQFDQTTSLFVYLLYFITQVARYAETNAVKRASRNLPTNADLNVNTKIAGNELLWIILESATFQKAIEIYLPEKILDKDLVQKVYNELTETTQYQEYISVEGRDKNKEREIIKLIFTHLMLPNESFTSHIEEHYNNWDDDAEMMEQLMLNYIQKPASYNLQEMVSQEKWQFAKSLLITSIEKKEQATELIKPKLKNWDAERIAQLDMVLMRMGVCELLYFETIPTKVTINEYIDLAKEYSTQQSGQFVNGILDNIHKELTEAGKIQKIGYKK
ncbi:transcription antitermination factor NusB [Sediminibacterium goheungense]|uniref:Transcription antitermination protein NusB n=1 Tax=Sediminibacterium goheungense TaxID=1086393 RepID=A0A4R6IMW7_9BACT|nr:transcription antitermination factor NusB [Sediminibacterium goheungense]TDO23441.1 NusB antitermination factor [Sediminibacterium goheungense]TDO25044.1 NusB antitermination factor [Sediminibacterium goheungense]